jgi:hypothetical protein
MHHGRIIRLEKNAVWASERELVEWKLMIESFDLSVANYLDLIEDERYPNH